MSIHWERMSGVSSSSCSSSSAASSSFLVVNLSRTCCFVIRVVGRPGCWDMRHRSESETRVAQS